MKALVRFIIFGAVLFPVFSIAISCSEEADCSMTTRAMMQCYLYTLDPDTKVVSNDTLDSLTVTAFGTDSVIINNQKKVHDLSLPLRYTTDSTITDVRYSRHSLDSIRVANKEAGIYGAENLKLFY